MRALWHLVDVLLPLCAHYGINLTFYGTMRSLWHLADVCKWNTGLFGILSISSTEIGYYQVSFIHIAAAATSTSHNTHMHTSTHGDTSHKGNNYTKFHVLVLRSSSTEISF